MHHDELFLVQARPITTVTDDTRTDDGFDFSCGIETTYTTAGVTEMLPGVLPPLLWGVDSWLVENGFRALFEMLGGGAAELTDGHALIGRFGGRAALNLDAMRQAAGSIPGGSPEELEQQYFGAAREDRRGQSPRRRTRCTGRVRARRVRACACCARVGAPAQESEIAIQTVARLVDREPDVGELDDLRALRVLEPAAPRGTAGRGGRGHGRGHGVGELSQRRGVPLAVHGLRGRRRGGAESSPQPTPRSAGPGSALAVEPSSRQLRARSRTLRRRRRGLGRHPRATRDHGPRCCARAADAGARGARPARPASSPARHGRRFRSSRGWPCTRSSCARSRLPTSPAAPSDASSSSGKLTRDETWRAARWATLQVLDVRRRFFRRQTSEAAEFLDRRELTKAAYLQLGGLIRRCHLEFGRRLVERGRLEQVEDIELVGINEIGRMCDGRWPDAADDRATAPTQHARRTRLRRSRSCGRARRSSCRPTMWSASGSRVGARAPGATKASRASCTHPTRRSSAAARCSSRRPPTRHGRRCSSPRARSSSNRAGRCPTPRSWPVSSDCRPW